MFHHSLKSDDPVILDNRQKNCQEAFLGKILFIFVLFFLFLFFFLSEKGVLALSTDCYVNGNNVGSLIIAPSVSFPPDWTIYGSNADARISFHTSGEVQNNEIDFKLGTSDWKRAYDYYGYLYYITFYDKVDIGTSRCGFYWGNIRWRSTRDSQLHYCNLKIPNYDIGPTPVVNFVNLSCISSTCKDSSNSLARGAVISGAIHFPLPQTGRCEDYKININSQSAKDGGFFTQTDCAAYRGSGTVSSSGLVEFSISSQPTGGFTSAQASLQTYNYINETSCGDSVIPVPTSIPKLKCKTVFGYVKNKLTGKGIKNATINVHGIDNSSGKCLGKHYGCSTVKTNSSGYFQANCGNVSDINISCLGVYETNAYGFTDSNGLYGPSGSEAWNLNTIMFNNPPIKESCGPFVFFDKR